MKRSAKPLYPQMNLPLFHVPVTATPSKQRNELISALMELLTNAAEAKSQPPANGAEDESETYS
jgi:hypothetical protein